jgi:integrase
VEQTTRVFLRILAMSWAHAGCGRPGLGRQCGVGVYPHRFGHHFSHTWLDRGGAEGDLMELNGWSSPQMLRRYGASARSARARRSHDRVMEGKP